MRLLAVGAALVLGASWVDAQAVPPASGFVVPGSLDVSPANSKDLPADSVRPRPRATEYSDAYETRLTIHRIGSYTMLPMFAAEYVLGQRLLNGGYANWVKPAHGLVAGGIAVLFGVNTVTGVWNLAESRHDPEGRTRRLIHSALMIGADAGFVWTGATASGSRRSQDTANRHRNIAIGSMGLSTAGAVMMWLWKN
jgi:hypothetical protein